MRDGSKVGVMRLVEKGARITHSAQTKLFGLGLVHTHSMTSHFRKTASLGDRVIMLEISRAWKCVEWSWSDGFRFGRSYEILNFLA